MKVHLILGHSKTRPGARNRRRNIYEFDFNGPVIDDIYARREKLLPGVDLRVDGYRSRGNVSRWNGKSELLVELHANAGGGSGGFAMYAHGIPSSRRIAEAAGTALCEATGLHRRGNKGAVPVKGPATWDAWGRDPLGLGGGYLLWGLRQKALIFEPFFIDNDADFAHVQSIDYPAAVAAGIAAAVRQLQAEKGENVKARG